MLALEHGLKPFAIAAVFVLVALLWTFPLQHWIDYRPHGDAFTKR